MMIGNRSDSNGPGSGGSPSAARKAKDEALVQVVISEVDTLWIESLLTVQDDVARLVPRKLFEHRASCSGSCIGNDGPPDRFAEREKGPPMASAHRARPHHRPKRTASASSFPTLTGLPPRGGEPFSVRTRCSPWRRGEDLLHQFIKPQIDLGTHS
jgi:hypothetical protein